MSLYASLISTVSSLPQVSLLSSGYSSSSSTKPNIGWGSPNVADMSTLPANNLETPMATPINPFPILSIDIPIHAHYLCEGTLDDHQCDDMHSLLYPPHIPLTLKSHLDTDSLLWSITCIYLQNQQLKNLLDLASSPTSIGHHCNILQAIQQTIQEDLFPIFYQLHMLEFVQNVHRTICCQVNFGKYINYKVPLPHPLPLFPLPSNLQSNTLNSDTRSRLPGPYMGFPLTLLSPAPILDIEKHALNVTI